MVGESTGICMAPFRAALSMSMMSTASLGTYIDDRVASEMWDRCSMNEESPYECILRQVEEERGSFALFMSDLDGIDRFVGSGK